ncbi:MAG TPA: hypothetical protein ENJ95_17610 [Bacteroidetes bacterium]|nr:hypothetical protein [Bacteroidota bacterium]
MAFDFKSIKSLFVVEEGNTGAKKAAPAKKAKAAADPKKAIVQESSSGQPGKVTDKFMQILLGALEKNNLPGVDYLEYKQSLKSLEKMPMEEKVRYQSAFAMAQAMGATPQKLVQTASHYLDVLKGEESKFQQALAGQQSSKIAARKEKIKQLESIIQQKTKQIQQLTQDLEKHKKEVGALSQEIDRATSKMETTKNNFIASYNALVSQILKDVENMKKYLK